MGSVPSLIIHTMFFASIFVLGFSGAVAPDYIFAVTTNILSIEAIYLAIFIQMTVNRHQKELEEVSEDVEDIQEDIEEISEDVEDIQEDVQEFDQKREERKEHQSVTLETLSRDIQQIVVHLEELKKK